MDLDTGDKVRFKTGAYSTLKMGTQAEWRLGLEGLIGEVKSKHSTAYWHGQKMHYWVRVHHPKSGITVTDVFDMDEIEGPLVEAGFGKQPATDNAVTGSLSREPECDYRGALAECHSLDCPVHGKNKP